MKAIRARAKAPKVTVTVKASSSIRSLLDAMATRIETRIQLAMSNFTHQAVMRSIQQQDRSVLRMHLAVALSHTRRLLTTNAQLSAALDRNRQLLAAAKVELAVLKATGQRDPQSVAQR